MNQIFHLVFRHKQSSSPHYLLISIRLFASASLRSGPPFTAHKNHSTNAKKKIEPLYRTVKSGLSLHLNSILLQIDPTIFYTHSLSLQQFSLQSCPAKGEFSCQLTSCSHLRSASIISAQKPRQKNTHLFRACCLFLFGQFQLKSPKRKSSEEPKSKSREVPSDCVSISSTTPQS